MAHECKYELPKCEPDTLELIQMILKPKPAERATWEQIFASKFVTSRCKIANDALQMTFENAFSKPIRFMTQTDSATIGRLNQELGVEDKKKEEQKPAGNYCPFCGAQLHFPKVNAVANFPVKKAQPLPKAQTYDAAFQGLINALAGAGQQNIVFDAHTLIMKSEVFEVRIFVPNAGKFFASIGCGQDSEFDLFKQQLAQWKVGDVSAICTVACKK